MSVVSKHFVQRLDPWDQYLKMRKTRKVHCSLFLPFAKQGINILCQSRARAGDVIRGHLSQLSCSKINHFCTLLSHFLCTVHHFNNIKSFSQLTKLQMQNCKELFFFETIPLNTTYTTHDFSMRNCSHLYVWGAATVIKRGCRRDCNWERMAWGWSVFDIQLQSSGWVSWSEVRLQMSVALRMSTHLGKEEYRLVWCSQSGWVWGKCCCGKWEGH